MHLSDSYSRFIFLVVLRLRFWYKSGIGESRQCWCFSHDIFGVIMVYSGFWGCLDSLEEDRSVCVGGGVSSIVVKK